MIRTMFSFLGKLNRLQRSWPVLAICMFYIYLAFHALSGSQGLMSWVDYEADIDRLTSELEALEARKANLEFQIDSLRRDGLNRDLLDYKASELAFYS